MNHSFPDKPGASAFQDLPVLMSGGPRRASCQGCGLLQKPVCTIMLLLCIKFTFVLQFRVPCLSEVHCQSTRMGAKTLDSLKRPLQPRNQHLLSSFLKMRMSPVSPAPAFSHSLLHVDSLSTSHVNSFVEGPATQRHTHKQPHTPGIRTTK